MEDSFRVRVERAFGSLSSSSSSSSSSTAPSSLWSLTDDEIDNTPFFNRNNKPYSATAKSSSSFPEDLDDDDQDKCEDEDEDETSRVPSCSKPDDYDDEQWDIKSSIGLDSTLDYEEEEDYYDKQAIGKENSGDRLYMKDIKDDGIDMNSCDVLPTTFRDFVRDPRANHLAAKSRLRQDDEAAKKIDALYVSEKSAPVNGGDVRGNPCEDAVNPKSILKSTTDNPSEPKPQKRVRFDSECDDRGNDEPEGTRDVRMKTSSMEEVTASNQSSKSQEFALSVPDYIRNPSRYTHYTFDSSGDLDDESNKQAYMDFFSQLKRSNAATGSQADDALDDLPSVSFIPKKKPGDAKMVENDVVSKQNLDVGMQRRAFSVGIAAGDTETSGVCAMEEDVPEVFEDIKKSSQRLNRQYRKKSQEELEEPIE